MSEAASIESGSPQQLVQAGRSYEEDREAARERSEKLAWRVATAASVIAVIAVVGIVLLAPFRRNIPYLFSVDESTGNVEFIEAANDRTVVGYQELLDKHWVSKYVAARESYLWKLLQNDYDTVLALSTDEVGRDYATRFDGDNALDKKLGKMAELRVQILSVTPSQDAVGTKAVVRFERQARRIDTGATLGRPEYYVATLSYEYRPSMSGREKDLIANPLGFRVTGYRLDAELTTPTVSAR